MTPQQERYRWLKSHGICVSCGQQKAFGKYVKCADCIYKFNESYYRYIHNCTSEQKEERKKQQAECQRKKRAYRIEHNLCVTCGKELADTQYKSCLACRRKNVAKVKKYNAKKKGTFPSVLRGNGEYCYFCCKPVEHHGDKMCNSCYERQLQNLAKAREATNKELLKQNFGFPKGYFKNKE